MYYELQEVPEREIASRMSKWTNTPRKYWNRRNWNGRSITFDFMAEFVMDAIVVKANL